MSMVAIIPVAGILAANALLDNVANTPGKKSHGPNNFSVPAYTGAATTHGALHSWDGPEFEADVKAIPNVVWEISDGDPVARTQALIEAQGAKWGAQAPPLPSTGTVTAGSLYQFDTLLWSVIQTFSRTTYSADPSTYPALIRRVHTPGELQPWRQPLDQYDAYQLVNPFNGLPDRCTHHGITWTVTQADGSGNNVWEPGVFGWSGEGVIAPPAATWVDTGVTIAQLVGAGVYRVSAVLAGLTLGQALRLGATAETVFNGYWPTANTPSDYLKITPHVSAAVGAKVWKWA